MLLEYIQKALVKAQYKILDDGTWFAEIPGFEGVWANAKSVEECRHELQEVLEEWLVLKIRDRNPIPKIEGVSSNLSLLNRPKDMFNFISGDFSPFVLLFYFKRHVLIYKIKDSPVGNGFYPFWMVDDMPYKIKCHPDISFNKLFSCHYFIPFLNFSLYHSHLSFMSCSA